MLDRRKFVALVPAMLTMSQASLLESKWFEKSVAASPTKAVTAKPTKRQIINWDSRGCALPIDCDGERVTWSHCSCANYANVDWFERTTSSGIKFQYFSLHVKLGGTTYSFEKSYSSPWKFMKTDKLEHYYDHASESFA